MDINFHRAMYGGNSRVDRTAPLYVPQNNEEEKDYGKAPSRVIGGLKAQNAHITSIEVDNKQVDIPRVEYVKALEEEIKALKIRDSVNTKKIIRFESTIRSLETRLQSIDSAIKNIETNNKNQSQNVPRFQSFKPKTRS